MSLAIQWGYYDSDTNPPVTEGFLYFSAVSSYKQSYTGSVSKHPIDGGGNITDHFTKENPIITISAVLSGVDISTKYKAIVDNNGNTPTNLKNAPDSVKVNSTDKSLVSLLPASIGQFFTPQKPKVVLAAQSVDTLDEIKNNLTELFNNNKIELVKLFEYQGNNLRNKPIENLVITSLVFSEDVNSGQGLYFDITLEQITFASYKKTPIPNNIKLSGVTSEGTADKGKIDSTPNTGPPPLLKRPEVKESLAHEFGISKALKNAVGG